MLPFPAPVLFVIVMLAGWAVGPATPSNEVVPTSYLSDPPDTSAAFYQGSMSGAWAQGASTRVDTVSSAFRFFPQDGTDKPTFRFVPRSQMRPPQSGEDCRLDAVDPGMVHQPDTTVVTSIGVVPPTSRFEPLMRVLTPCHARINSVPSPRPGR